MTVAAPKRSRTKGPPSDPVSDYARAVLAGDVPAGQWVHKACQRHLDDLEHGHERGLYFSEKDAGLAIRFFGFLRHYKGEWAGQPLKLEPWQEFIGSPARSLQ